MNPPTGAPIPHLAEGLLHLPPDAPPTSASLLLVRPSLVQPITSVRARAQSARLLTPAPPPCYVLLPSSILRRAIDAAIVVILVYNVIFTPFRIAFALAAPLWLFVCETVMDAIFIGDLVANFVTAVVDESTTPPTLVTSFSAIAVHYLKSWFAVDFVSSFPIDLVLLLFVDSSSNERDVWRLSRTVRTIKLLRLVRLLRIVRISRVIRKWRFRFNINSAYLRLAKLFVVMLMYAHLTACSWFYVATTRPASARTWIDEANLRTASIGSQYVGALYWSLTTVTGTGYGDIVPTSTDERIFVICALVIGVSIFSLAVGATTQLVSRLAASPLNDRLDHVNSYMKFRALSKELQDEIRDFYLDTWESQQAIIDEKTILTELSTRLRNSVSLFVNEHALACNTFFTGVSGSFVSACLLRVTTSAASPGDVIVREGMIGQELYLIFSGTATVTNDDHSLLFATLGEGTYFGELALLSAASIRTATVTAVSHVKLGVLSLADLIDVLATHPDDVDNWALLRTARLRAAHLNATVDAYTAEWDTNNPAFDSSRGDLDLSVQNLLGQTGDWWHSLTVRNNSDFVSRVERELVRDRTDSVASHTLSAAPTSDAPAFFARTNIDPDTVVHVPIDMLQWSFSADKVELLTRAAAFAFDLPVEHILSLAYVQNAGGINVVVTIRSSTELDHALAHSPSLLVQIEVWGGESEGDNDDDDDDNAAWDASRVEWSTSDSSDGRRPGSPRDSVSLDTFSDSRSSSSSSSSTPRALLPATDVAVATPGDASPLAARADRLAATLARLSAKLED